MESKWKYWVNERVFLDKGVSNIVKRKHALYFFCRDGLVPFLQSVGYTFGESDAKITRKLLLLLFHLQENSPIVPYEQPCEFYEEQYALYCHTIDSRDWELFWKRWEGLQDIDDPNIGYKYKAILPEFVWSWLDLENSKPAYELQRELLDIYYEEEASKGRDDPYLQETQSRDYQDRHWH